MFQRRVLEPRTRSVGSHTNNIHYVVLRINSQPMVATARAPRRSPDGGSSVKKGGGKAAGPRPEVDAPPIVIRSDASPDEALNTFLALNSAYADICRSPELGIDGRKGVKIADIIVESSKDEDDEDCEEEKEEEEVAEEQREEAAEATNERNGKPSPETPRGKQRNNNFANQGETREESSREKPSPETPRSSQKKNVFDEQKEDAQEHEESREIGIIEEDQEKEEEDASTDYDSDESSIPPPPPPYPHPSQQKAAVEKEEAAEPTHEAEKEEAEEVERPMSPVKETVATLLAKGEEVAAGAKEVAAGANSCIRSVLSLADCANDEAEEQEAKGEAKDLGKGENIEEPSPSEEEEEEEEDNKEDETTKTVKEEVKAEEQQEEPSAPTEMDEEKAEEEEESGDDSIFEQEHISTSPVASRSIKESSAVARQLIQEFFTKEREEEPIPCKEAPTTDEEVEKVDTTEPVVEAKAEEESTAEPIESKEEASTEEVIEKEIKTEGELEQADAPKQEGTAKDSTEEVEPELKSEEDAPKEEEEEAPPAPAAASKTPPLHQLSIPVDDDDFVSPWGPVFSPAKSQTLYDVLQVDRNNCTSADIKSAYKKLALTYHPDRYSNGDSADADCNSDMFMQVQHAYDVLSDEVRKIGYDAELKLVELKESLANMTTPTHAAISDSSSS